MMKAVKRVRLALVYVSLIAISLMFAGTNYAEIDPKTCVGVWLFDEGKGDIAKDYSGKENDGKLMNDLEWVDGRFGKALRFDGEDSYVETIKNIGISGNQPRTLMAWVNWDGEVNKGDKGHRQGIVQIGGSEARESSTLYIWDGPGKFKFQTNWNDLHSADAYAKPDVWYHFAVAWDDMVDRTGIGKAWIYIDGVLNKNSFLAELITPDTVVTIGGDPTKVLEDKRIFNGLIDEVAIFNVALKEEDIKAIINKGLEAALDIDIITAVSPTGKLTTTWANIKQ